MQHLREHVLIKREVEVELPDIASGRQLALLVHQRETDLQKFIILKNKFQKFIEEVEYFSRCMIYIF